MNRTDGTNRTDRTDGKRRAADLISRDRRGQSLILALMILFMLVFIGGLFVTIVAKNLGRTQRSGQTLSADYIAETGIRYASDQFTYGLDGADWRPAPNYPEIVKWVETGLPVGGPPAADSPKKQDPDYVWLMDGFCRFTYGTGRFLLRVTYNPRLGDPTSKFIKIEAVGRPGIVDENDPTTINLKQPIRLRAEKVAYKAIAITDYARFITNRDRRSDTFALGVPAYTQPDGTKRAFVTQYGDVSDKNGDGNPDPAGGSIRVNGNLMWYGTNYIWLDRMRNESVEVAGDITHATEWDRGSGVPPPDATAVYVNPPAGIPGAWQKDLLLRQSADPLFDTSPDPLSPDVGIYRDGSPERDVGKRPRSIRRLEPPLLDETGPAGGLGRYRELTRNSGEWRYSTVRSGWYNTGYYGWGAGIYVNNREDIQSESELGTLRDDWMNPGGSQYWSGPYYTPPGVIVVLTPYDLDDDNGDQNAMTGRPDMILMQSNAAGAKFNWYDPDGNVLVPSGGQLVVPYPKNGVLFAEGNVRIKGTLPPHTQLTVVSGGTIYVEGNILKWRVSDTGRALKDSQKDSAIALLATDYVCVNTTQFFGPAPESPTPANWRPDMSCYAASVDNPLSFSFSFGEDADAKYVKALPPIPICVYVRHTADRDANPSYMNMTINQAGVGLGSLSPWFGLYYFNVGAGAPLTWPLQAPTAALRTARQYIYPLSDPEAVTTLTNSSDPVVNTRMLAEQRWPIWEHQVYTLLPAGNGQDFGFNTDPGAANTIGFSLDPNMAKADYLLSRFAIQPSDIKIEALMYAQNGSFFVIPGDWFNPDANDTVAGGPNGRSARQCIDSRWPLHGQPVDVEVSIRGAISENVPAPLADQAEWMEKWGWIPPAHGSSTNAIDQTVVYRDPLDPNDNGTSVGNLMAPIRQRGLRIMYDTQLSYPKVPDPAYPTDNTHDLPIRRDAFMRPLPIAPKLPVSGQTLFFGEPT